MSKSLLGGGAAAALLSFSFFFYAAGTTTAEPLASASQEPSTQQNTDAPASTVSPQTTITAETNPSQTSGYDAPVGAKLSTRNRRALAPPQDERTEKGGTFFAPPPQSFVATAYSLRGRTASGKIVQRGIIAADRRILPLGTRVRIDAGSYSGEYVVADTGGAVRGRKIDIWMPSGSEAMRFGRRPIKLTVLTHHRKPSAPPARGRN